MPIDFSKVRALTAGEIIRALLADGFVMRKHTGGSHRRYERSDGRHVTVLSTFTTARVFRVGQNDRADNLMAANLRS